MRIRPVLIAVTAFALTIPVLLCPPNAHAKRIRKVKIPSVLGLSISRATSVIQSAGLRVRVVGHSRGYGTRVVHGQSPRAGQLMVRGGQVRISFRYVPSRQKPRIVHPPNGATPRAPTNHVTLPSVLGLNPARARVILRARGLRARFPGGLPRRGVLAKVSHQSIKPGTSVSRGASILLYWRRVR